MEISLNKSELAGALTALGKLVCRRSPIPAYHAVQIESNNNTLFFRTHSSDEEIEFRMEADGMDAFKVAVDFDFFRSLVRNSKNKNLKIESKDGTFRIDGVAVVPIEGEWPVTEVPQGENVTTSPLPWNFVEFLSAAAPLIDMENPRKILRGINLSADGITATNGKELFNRPYRFNLDDLTMPFPLALMATKTFGIGTLTAWNTGLCTMFSVRLGRWRWTAKALPGAYPDWRRIVPKKTDLKHSVGFTVEHADRLKTFLKSVADKRPSNEIKLYRNKAGYFTLRDGDGRESGILASFNSGWEDFSITVSKEILLHLLNEGHTEIRFGDTMSPFVASGGIGQYIAAPMRHQTPHVQTEQKSEQATSSQTDAKDPAQTEQTAPHIAKETKESTNTTNTTSNKENPTMGTNNITHVVSAPVQTSALNHEQNPLDELAATIEAMKTKLKAMFDESAAMSRKVREVALAQRQKEREYVQTKRALDRVRVASGAA